MAKRLVLIQKGHLDPELFKDLDGINIFHISICVWGAKGFEELRGFSPPARLLTHNMLQSD